jgi:hypothetical protein
MVGDIINSDNSQVRQSARGSVQAGRSFLLSLLNPCEFVPLMSKAVQDVAVLIIVYID